MYSYIKDDDKCGKTAKGIKTNAVKNMYNMKIIKTYYLITNTYIIKCKLSEATIINLEAKSSIKCHYFASTIKGIYLMVEIYMHRDINIHNNKCSQVLFQCSTGDRDCITYISGVAFRKRDALPLRLNL